MTRQRTPVTARPAGIPGTHRRKDKTVPILIDDVITSIEVEREHAVRARDKSIAEVKYIIDAANRAGRTSLTPEESARVEDAFKARDEAKTALVGIDAKLDQAKRAKAEEIDQAHGQEQRIDTGVRAPGRPTATTSVTRNERTYRKDIDRKGTVFLRDVARQFLYQDPDAAFRLSSHMQEERVERSEYMERANAGTGNFAGLVVPQYLVDMYAPAVAAMRPFADVCNKHELPSQGMTVNIPLLTTATSVGLQGSENSAGSSTAPNDTLLTENVQTATGNVTLSRQAIDRGYGIDEVTMQDLFKRYATNLDSTLINQATTGLSALAGTFAGTLASGLSISTLYSKILGATAGVEANLLAQAIPSHVITYSSRWYWMSAQVGANFPFINQMGAAYPWNGGVADASSNYNTGPRGVLPSGLKVIVDNNVPNNLGVGTNQDELYVVASDECHLWEDPDAPIFIRAEQPAAASLGVLMVLYGYFAYSFRRYTGAVQKVAGAALTTPSF
jgi:HK97 family phage major capsid protein